MRSFLFFGLMVSCSFVSAQQETHHWYFGTFVSLDFNSGVPVPGSSPMTTSEGTASVSNANGDLLFYTNGVEVYDSSHVIMPNGTGLRGNVSTTQSALIVPSPSNSSQYYLFTADADGGTNGFCYSIVDMTLNSGYGDVTGTKNVLLTDSISEKIAAVRIPTTNDYWIVTHKYGTNQFYAYQLDASGLSSPVITNVGTIHNTTTFQNTYGQMKFNMCGDKLALALGYMDQVDLYDFNLTSGVVSNPIILPMSDHVYGLEFSPSSNYLYVTCYDPTVSLSQFDLTSGNQSFIQASESPISSTDDLYGMQLGPDGKIYVSRSFGSSYLGIIQSPESAGFACNYIDNGIDLDPNFNGYNGALSLPSFMQSYLGNDPSCDGSLEVEENIRPSLGSAFPNPSLEEINFISHSGNSQITLTDITGHLIFTLSDVSRIKFGNELSSGIYFLSIIDGEKTEIIKLIKH